MCYHYFISVCLWYDIIDITRLLRMIYVLWLVFDGNSCREGFLLSSYEHLCDRVVHIFTYYLHFLHTTYYVFLKYEEVSYMLGQ